MTRKVVRKIGHRTSRRSSSSNRTTTTTISGRTAPGKFGRQKPLPDLVTTKSTSGNSNSSVTQPVTQVVNANYSGLIFLLLVVLLILAFWNDYFLPIWDALWSGKTPNFKYDFGPLVGSFVFIIILSILGAIPSLSGVVLLFTLGLWVVFFIMGDNTGTPVAILNFLAGKSSSNNNNSAGNTATPQKGAS